MFAQITSEQAAGNLVADVVAGKKVKKNECAQKILSISKKINNTPMNVKDMASLGGQARAKALTKKRRKEIAMMGVEARKKKAKKVTNPKL